MSDVTQILTQIDEGDPAAAKQLLPLVYEELRKLAATKLAREQPGQTLQATALVHEAYVRLVDSEQPQAWNGRGHFFSAAAEAMRRILIERARAKKRAKRGDSRKKLDLDAVHNAIEAPPDTLLELNDALERLRTDYPECGELVKLRFFAGMSLREAAMVLGLSRRTADRYWAYARAWLHQQLK